MKSSSKDKIAGTAKEVKGSLKTAAGKLTGNERLKAEGASDKSDGRVQKKVGEIEKVFEQ